MLLIQPNGIDQIMICSAMAALGRYDGPPSTSTRNGARKVVITAMGSATSTRNLTAKRVERISASLSSSAWRDITGNSAIVEYAGMMFNASIHLYAVLYHPTTVGPCMACS